jgi:hypothetical protein
MNQFQIVCHACAARLKVTKPSMIGKLLACPKCGTMLQITPPESNRSPDPQDAGAGPVEGENRVIAAPGGNEGKGEAVKTILTQTDFDEIDNLLKTQKDQLDPFAKKTIPADRAADPPQKSPADSGEPGAARKVREGVGQPAGNRSGRSVFRDPPESGTSSPSPRSEEGSVSADGPLLPNDQWVSPEMRQRKKRLQLLGALVGLSVLALALTAAWYARSNTDSIVSQTEELPPPAALPDQPVEEEPDQDADDRPAAVEPQVNDDLPIADLGKPAEAGPESPDPVSNSFPADPPPLGNAVGQTSEPTGETGGSDSRDPIATGASDRNGSGIGKNNATDPGNRTDPPAGIGEADADSEADRLNELLESSGFSWTAMRDLVSSLRGEQSFGIPKYYFQQGTTELPDLNRQMEIPLPYLKYEQTPLSLILRDLIDLTGVPLTIEPASLQARLSVIDPKVSIELRETTIGKGLDQILTAYGLTRVAQPRGGVIIFAEGFNQVAIVEHPLPRWTEEDPEKRRNLTADFIAGARQLVFPDSWDAQADVAEIRAEEGRLKVSQLPVAQQQIAELIAKVDAAMAVAADPLDTAAIRLLTTKSERIARKLDQPSGLSHQLSQSFSTLLGQLQKNTGVTLLADWESLSTQGWAPDTRVPGTFNEPSLRKVLDEMARSMGITYVIFDQETVLLTTFETATRYSDVEVYSFGKILEGKLNETQALNLLHRSIGEELAYPNVRVVYEPNYRGLIVVAPQLIQRRIAAVLKALEEI